ncbi:histidine triad nucleotide-binding protein [Lentisphaera profundi]|uniref:Histidine triad nucleotide-binding protein n=1 Tax=Lentisphaera profundi TaxID=1658616 RepID=A0ABY7VSC5_9BACT|nr:histidine triad nucleotide-binding protein [Lentisphaera profundi]WDE96947.1 histidine triad nucleotide-binding protein [Lentisphaera profundi]
MSTIFSKIIAGEIPADVVYEDEHCLAFKDINAIAPMHILLIPKKELVNLSDAKELDKELLGHMMLKTKEIADSQGFEDYRVVTNNGAGAQQSVFHLHFHIIGGRSLNWPPG